MEAHKEVWLLFGGDRGQLTRDWRKLGLFTRSEERQVGLLGRVAWTSDVMIGIGMFSLNCGASLCV